MEELKNDILHDLENGLSVQEIMQKRNIPKNVYRKIVYENWSEFQSVYKEQEFNQRRKLAKNIYIVLRREIGESIQNLMEEYEMDHHALSLTLVSGRSQLKRHGIRKLAYMYTPDTTDPSKITTMKDLAKLFKEYFQET